MRTARWRLGRVALLGLALWALWAWWDLGDVGGGGDGGGARALSPAPPPQGADADLRPPPLAAQDRRPAAAAAPAAACPLPPALDPRDRALALHRVAAQLASGTAADAVLALLLQAPADPAPAWREQVRQRALGARDAQALAWAAAACDTIACRRELLQARLRLEPDNAAHWLAWLDENPEASDEAWQGLAAARRWRDPPAALAERVAQALPPGGTPAQQQALLQALLQPLREPGGAAAPLPSAILHDACGHHGETHPIGKACANLAALGRATEQAPDPAARPQGGGGVAPRGGHLTAPTAPSALPAPPAPAPADRASPCP